MIKFFRDFLDGPIYFVVAGISIILIMAIIGFIMERKKLEQEEMNKRVVVDDTPIDTVEVREEILTDDVVTTSVESSVQTIPNPVINQEVQLNPSDMIQNPELTTQEQVVEEKQVESLSQPAVQVIDFGSTSSVDIEH